MGEPFRFRPPTVGMTPEVRWLLARAFGPPDGRLGGIGDLDPAQIVKAGAKLDLLARIAARTSRETLVAEIGDDLTSTLEDWFEAAAVQVNSLCKMVGDVADVAANLKVPMVILKGMTLHLSGWATVGSRPMGDVDILVPRNRAEAIQGALLQTGFEETYRGRFQEDVQGHLRPLRSPHGLGAEIHFAVHNLSCAGGDTLTCDDVFDLGLARPAPGLPDHCHVPDENLLVTHLLVHGIVKHGAGPGSYAAGRVISDVADVPWGPSDWTRFLAGPFSWIEDVVSRREVAAIVGLVERLRAGGDPAEISAGKDDEAAVLNHLVSVVEWHDYDRLLALRRRRDAGLRSLLWPGDGLGDDAGIGARVMWRVKRPFRVAAKLASIGIGQARGALRRVLR